MESILYYEDFVANADVVPATLGIRPSCGSPARTTGESQRHL